MSETSGVDARSATASPSTECTVISKSGGSLVRLSPEAAVCRLPAIALATGGLFFSRAGLHPGARRAASSFKLRAYLAVAEAGHNVLMSDADIVWLRDPFQHWDRAYDFQGLSDIRSVNLTVQAHHEITCMRPWMENMYEHGRRSIYPCQSTGLWYMRDLPQSRAFLATLYGYLQARPNEWEQKAFQLLVMRFLVGIGDELPPLRHLHKQLAPPTPAADTPLKRP